MIHGSKLCVGGTNDYPWQDDSGEERLLRLAVGREVLSMAGVPPFVGFWAK